MNKQLIRKIKKWCKDFESQFPKNVQIDSGTFEEDAHLIFQEVLKELRKVGKPIKVPFYSRKKGVNLFGKKSR